ncbi:MAG TPA: hypothetical protein VH740_04100 [Vicinamibacterales bacterium]|jgi:hypothetical protein
MGIAITIRLALAFVLTAGLSTASGQGPSEATGVRYALIVSGASGGPEYADQYAKWTRDLSTVLVDRMKIGRDRIKVLSETNDPANAATAANVRQFLGAVRRSMTRDDLLLIVLIGHGTYDGVDAKFNLVGTDLESAQWAELLAALPGQVVAVNTSSASFPFIERLSGDRRVVIAATDSVAQRFDTIFPEFFIKAFQGDAADIDKNDRISIWEAFSSATGEVRRYYQRRGQLSTERALLDDNGDGLGREAAGKGDDGSFASRVYLDVPLPGAPPTDEVLVKLLQQRAAIEAELDELKIRRSFLRQAEYQQEFERLIVELARVNRDIRARVKS